MKRDYVGQRFGKLTVIREVEPKIYKSKLGYDVPSRRVLCLCDCGSEKVVNLSSLLGGDTTSCGCYRNSQIAKAVKHHNTYEINGDVTKVFDSKGNFCLIDTEDLDKVKPYCFHKNHYGYFKSTSLNSSMHRLIMGAPKGMVVDHINHDTLDNRKCNLRVCTQQENTRNKKAKGVCYHKASNKYIAYIIIDQKQKYLGLFKELEDAIKVRKEAEQKYFGDFAYKEE